MNSRKGFFPHFFNTEENVANYRGKIPALLGEADWVDAVVNRTVYLFLNCFENGCRMCCFPHWQKNQQHPAVTNREAREALRYKCERLERMGYTVRVMWECEWAEDRENEDDVKYFNPRDAFYGGRTEVVRHYVNLDEEEGTGREIRYVDVCSLYPWVNRTCEYPVGHPIELSDVNSLEGLFGLADVTVRAPRGLTLPVLPDRVRGKLIFHLCRRCAEEQVEEAFVDRSARCEHTEEERAFRGTWCTPELEKAVAMGYVVLNIHRVWHFAQRSRELFKGYVDKWLKNKTEASGWPDECDTEEKRRAYVAEYNARYSVPIEYEKIETNPGLKIVSKQSLNSFWGKFGENSGKINVEVLDSTWMVWERFNDPCLEMESVLILNEDRVEVRYKRVIDDDVGGIVHNEFIAAFTTCHARLKLYSYLQQVRLESVLDMDTDSMVYYWKPGDPCIETTRYLGDMTNELKQGDHIVEFGCTGPKSYWFLTKEGHVTFKSKGFRSSVRTSEALNVESVRQVLFDALEGQDTIIDVYYPYQIVGDKNRDVRTELLIKEFHLTSDKRALCDEETTRTLHYGFY